MTAPRLLVLAEELVESSLQRYGLAGEIIARCEGKALELIPALREEFWKNLTVLGEPLEMNQALERAGG